MDKVSKMGFPAGSRDPMFDTPYVDIDEWRDKPVRHRYVHGGFKDTECRFSFYFPPSEHYEGRFFHLLLPVPGIETAAINAPAATTLPDPIPFAMDSGAYLVESNQGKTDMFTVDDTTITGYRASAAAARYSRVLAAEMYGSTVLMAMPMAAAAELSEHSLVWRTAPTSGTAGCHSFKGRP